MNKFRVLIRIMLAAIFIALAIWQTELLLAQLNGRGEAAAVETATVKEGPFVVGVTKEGNLDSADAVLVKAPGMAFRTTLLWVIDDGSKVKKNDLVAKLDISKYQFEVEAARMDYQNKVMAVGQEKRNREQDVKNAETEVEKAKRTVEVLSKSLLTETEQGQAQVGFNIWDLTFAQKDYDKQTRLKGFGIVPMTQVELAERNVRSKENAVGKSEKELSYLEAQHTVKKSQSKSDIETAEFNHDLAQRKIGLSVNSVQEQAAMQKRILDKMEENFAKGSLYSPKEGTVVLEPEWDRDGRRSLRAGDEIWGTRWLCKITDPATLQVIVGIDEAISNKLKVGQDAIISVKGILNREYAGKVISVGSVAHRYDPWEDEAANDPNRRVFDVVVKLLKPDPKLLRPGMKAKVRLVFKRIPKTIYIPSEAIFAKPSKGEVVYVQQGAGFEERRVKISERNDESVAIQSGLRPKDRVALKDPTRIEEK